MEENYRFQVNLGGMIDILSNHLYSSPDVFLRELLQNAVDAITAKKNTEEGCQSPKIEIELYEGSTIVFQDNGIGLTKDEIHQFLAMIGQSSKKDLLTGQIKEDYIGRFGIGMLSCFMVSDEIVVHTSSMKEDKCWEWRGKPDGTYTIKELEKGCPEGTTIYLKCKKGCEVYFTGKKIEEQIQYYGMLLPFPIILEYGGTRKQLNRVELPWEKDLMDRYEILSFGTEIFGEKFLDYIPIYTISGNVQGIAYILPYRVQPNAKQNHRIYLKNMLLTEKGSNILPDWAFFVKCILNTTKLRPTASREGFYEDEVLSEARDEIAGCISRYLASLAQFEEEKLTSIIQIHQLAIKSLAVENDELFQIFFDYFKFETTKGQISGRVLRSLQYPLIYTVDIDKFKQMAQVFTAQNRLLVNVGYVYEYELLQKMQDIFFVTCLPLNEDDVESIMEEASFEEQEDAYELMQVANKTLEKFDCEAEFRKFKPEQLPVFYSIAQDAMFYRDLKRSKEKSSSLFLGMLDAFEEDFKASSSARLYFNGANVLVQKLMKLKDRDKLSSCVDILYVQALLLGRYPLKNNEMEILNTGILDMLVWGIEGDGN